MDCNIIIRDKEWIIQANVEWKDCRVVSGAEVLRLSDLTRDEQVLVWNAWSRFEKKRIAKTKVIEKVSRDRDDEQFALGELIWFDLKKWYVASDFVWRHHWNGKDYDTVKRAFSELNNDEILLVIEAKRKQEKNTGVMGILRRLGRKAERTMDR